MGLDMYLFKRQQARQEVGYWRKANQIRNWFDTHLSDGVENCTEKLVTREILHELRDDCLKVLADHSLAEELLPTCSGFFFGSTEYDEYYFEDLKDTVEMVTKILQETDWDTEEIVYYEWW